MSAAIGRISVNGEVIPQALIASETQHHNAPSDKPGHSWRKAAKALVIRTLLLQEAGRLKLTPKPELLEGDKKETEDEAVIRAVLDQKLEVMDVSEEQCRKIYDNQKQLFRSPDLFQPAHILFAIRPEDKEARETAKKNAAVFIETIQKNPKAFADIAHTNSDCPSKDAGGTLGQIGAGDTVPEFEAVMANLQAGELHREPVETRFGIHILRMDEKAEGAILPFEAVKIQIMENLEQIAWARAAKLFTKQLIANADISGIDMNYSLKDSEPTGLPGH